MAWFGKNKANEKEITRGFREETVVKNNKTITLKVLKNEEGRKEKIESEDKDNKGSESSSLIDIGVPIDFGSPTKRRK